MRFSCFEINTEFLISIIKRTITAADNKKFDVVSNPKAIANHSATCGKIAKIIKTIEINNQIKAFFRRKIFLLIPRIMYKKKPIANKNKASHNTVGSINLPPS